MKLGIQTASVTNHIYSRMTVGQPDPIDGMGATILCWTDRHAATIICVDKSHTQTLLWVREDKATRTDKNGMSECQSYDFEPNPNGRVLTFRQTKSGGWEEVEVNQKTGRLNKVDGHGLRIGERAEYRDFSF